MKWFTRLQSCCRPAALALLAACLLTSAAQAQTDEPPVEPDGSAASQPTAPPPPPPAASPAADETTISVTRPGTFEIHVQGADLRGVLQLLSTQGKRNIIATKEVQGTVTADLYGVTFDQALKAVLASSGFDSLEDDGFIYVHTREEKAAIVQARIEPVVHVFHLSYINAADAQTLVTPALSESGTAAVTPAAAVGISASKTDAGGNALASNDVLVIRDTPANIKRVAELLEELDVKPEQVLVETTILSAELKEDNQLGVNFNALSGVEFQDLGFSAPTVGAQSITPTTITSGDVTAVNFRTDFQPVSGGMTFSVFGSDLAFFITALETVTDVTVLANPKLLIVNKQRGEVMVGRRDGSLTTTLTETTATQTVEFLETGTRLIVRPFIAKDRFIRMEIHPEDSDGSVQNSLPSETTTEVTSNVLVRDGHTIVIGGLFRENTNTTRSQIPFVGNIPYLGSLFRTHDDGTERDEVVILITPHIVNSPVDEAIGEQLKDDIERFRMGRRNGLRWWANDKLAQSHLQWAKQHLRSGNRDSAEWDLDMALSMKPQMIEAIRMKERLTQKAYWHDEARHSAIRYIVPRLIMKELGKPVEGVIPPDKPRRAEGLDPEVRKAMGIEPRIEPPWPYLVGPKSDASPGGEAGSADDDGGS